MNYWWLIALGAGVILLALPKRLDEATEDHPTDDPPATPIPTFPPELIAFAQAIASAEGFWSQGTIPNRAHNPGDLKLSGYPSIGNGISVFDDDDQGWAALYNQLLRIAQYRSSHYEPTMTIAQMARVWVGDSEGAKHWGNNVADSLGANLTDPIGNWLRG